MVMMKINRHYRFIPNIMRIKVLEIHVSLYRSDIKIFDLTHFDSALKIHNRLG